MALRDTDIATLVEVVRSLRPDARRVHVVGDQSALVRGLVAAAIPGCVVHVGLPSEASGAGDLDAVVLLDDAFDEGQPAAVLRRAVAALGSDGQVVSALRPARSAARLGRYLRSGSERGREWAVTRAEAFDLMASAGLAVTSCTAYEDPELRVAHLPVDGERADVAMPGFVLRDATAPDIEELRARRFVISAVPLAGLAAPPWCSVVVAVPACASADALLSAVGRTARRLGPDVELVVALGAPAGAVGSRLAQGLEACRVVHVLGPPTVARLWNAGVAHARGSFVGLLTADAVPDRHWLESLLRVLDGAGGETAGLAAGLVVDAAGRVVSAGYEFGPHVPYHTVPSLRGVGGAPDDPEVAHDRVAAAVTANGAVIRRQLFVDMGGLDVSYLDEDVGLDLSFRVRSRGLTCWVVPGAVVRCSGRKAVERAVAQRRDLDRRRFMERWGGRIAPDVPSRATAGRRRSRSAEPTRRSRRAAPTPVLWSGLLLDDTGYAYEARNMVLALDEAGVDVRANPLVWGVAANSIDGNTVRRLRHLLCYSAPPSFVHVSHFLASFDNGRVVRPMFERAPGAVLNVARTMFETDRIPPDWPALCNQMDEVWVPSRFNIETFTASGVDPGKLRAVASPLAPDWLHDEVEEFTVPGGEGHVFLSAFAWSLRKGWDVLVRAFVEEFDRGEAKLVLKVNPAAGFSVVDHRNQTERFLREVVGRDPRRCAEIVFIDAALTMTELRGLYGAADTFVLPSRGEGWGRPYMEAMAAGLPTVATGATGNLDFMDDTNSFLVEATETAVPPEGFLEVPQYRGHRWFDPSVDHLRRQMRRVLADGAEAARRADVGRRQVRERYSRGAVAEVMIDAIARHDVRVTPAGRGAASPVRVRWEGPQFVDFGMAVVNRELCRRLVSVVGIDLTVTDGYGAALAAMVDPRLAELVEAVRVEDEQAADVTVRHQWPPDFDRPAQGKLVVYQPWEYGSIPQAWVGPCNSSVDEVWVPSRFVRDSFIRSGVDPERVKVVPNGVDTELFQPAARPTDFETRASFRFLFVGGALWRKGADTLLEVFCDTFGPDDDVCLVVKDFGTGSFYRGQTAVDRIRAMGRDPALPEIKLVDWDLTPEALAGLYRACHCLVHPYRGEGFALPVVEAMACGLPVIVPRYGPALEYCDDDTALLVAAHEVTGERAQVDDLPTVSLPWWCEVDRDALAGAMRGVVADPEGAAAVGARAARTVASAFGWSGAADACALRLRELTVPGASRRSGAHRPRRREISLCMVVRNEEALLEGAIRSALPVADELVVVDTGSDDGTIAVAEALGAQVFRHPWTGSFADARNVAVEHATKDWVLMLDADQRLDAGSIEEVRRITQVDGLTGYLLRQFNYTADSGTDHVEHLIVRLFPNHPSVRYRGAVHEQVEAVDGSVPFHIGYSTVVLHHEGYRPRLRNARSKAERDRDVLTKAVAADDSDLFALYNLGMSQRALGSEPEAAAHLRRAVELGLDLPDGRRPAYLVHAAVELSRSLLVQGMVDQAVAQAELTVAGLGTTSADAWAVLGAAYVTAGRLDEALRAYGHIGELPPDLPALAPTDRSLARWGWLLGMGQVHLMAGRFDEAISVLERAVVASHGNDAVQATLRQARQREGVRP